MNTSQPVRVAANDLVIRRLRHLTATRQFEDAAHRTVADRAHVP